ncbi:hypothetical protein [Sediminibacterium ginsengisoli]|uniref:Uncharacterized protein n=1 Tax=Sediminibacterium ginsengisoli TaxID=413434 RepID=A0A1T4NNH8_9BACT|nr:hypothetical protein [Sediminibacterium ginsengisoli]SJZ80647.1 hypothetical protein SAMN04488132_104327 [Sediminibacterium ginsengisoli]
MEDNHLIAGETDDIGPFLSAIGKKTLYKVPEGYFEAFPALVGGRISASLLTHDLPYQVPEHYFEGLAGNILSKIRLAEKKDELAEIAPILAGMVRKMPFSVPYGYFDQLTVQKQDAAKPKAKIFTLRNTRRWMHYAAAAVVSGILVTGAFLFTDDDTGSQIDYEKYTRIDIPEALNKMSDAELVNYLSNNERVPLATAEQVSGNEELPDVKKHISLYSDSELKEYLEENSDIVLSNEATRNSD